MTDLSWYMFNVGGRWFIGRADEVGNNGYVLFSHVREILSGWEHVHDPRTGQSGLQMVFTIVTIPPFNEPQQMKVWNPAYIRLGTDDELLDRVKHALRQCEETEDELRKRSSRLALPS